MENKTIKTKKEIEQLAEKRFWKLNGKDFMDNEITHLEKSEYVSGYLSGYNQCQEDMADERKMIMETLLKIRDCKDYGNNSSTLAKELINSLNKQD
jgi:hypothetical protein